MLSFLSDLINFDFDLWIQHHFLLIDWITEEICWTSRRPVDSVAEYGVVGGCASTADGFESAWIRTGRQPVGRLFLSTDAHINLPPLAGVQLVALDSAFDPLVWLVNGSHSTDSQSGRRPQPNHHRRLPNTGLRRMEFAAEATTLIRSLIHRSNWSCWAHLPSNDDLCCVDQPPVVHSDLFLHFGFASCSFNQHNN